MVRGSQHFEIADEPKVVKLGSILWTFGMLLCFVLVNGLLLVVSSRETLDDDAEADVSAPRSSHNPKERYQRLADCAFQSLWVHVVCQTARKCLLGQQSRASPENATTDLLVQTDKETSRETARLADGDPKDVETDYRGRTKSPLACRAWPHCQGA